MMFKSFKDSPMFSSSAAIILSMLKIQSNLEPKNQKCRKTESFAWVDKQSNSIWKRLENFFENSI